MVHTFRGTLREILFPSRQKKKKSVYPSPLEVFLELCVLFLRAEAVAHAPVVMYAEKSTDFMLDLIGTEWVSMWGYII